MKVIERHKLIKILCFFFAGVAVEIIMYFIQYFVAAISSFFFIIVVELLAMAQVVLGFAARYLAENKMRMSAMPLVNAYIAGTFAPIIFTLVFSNFLYSWYPIDPAWAGEQPYNTMSIVSWMLYYAFPAVVINGIVQVLLCLRNIKRRKVMYLSGSARGNNNAVSGADTAPYDTNGKVEHRVLKTAGFFLAGVIVEIVLLIIPWLTAPLALPVGGYITYFFVMVLLAAAQVGLGFAARRIAVNKMYMPPMPLVLSYVIGTVVTIIAAFIIYGAIIAPQTSGYGLADLGNSLILMMLFLAIPAVVINGILQLVHCPRNIKRRKAVSLSHPAQENVTEDNNKAVPKADTAQQNAKGKPKFRYRKLKIVGFFFAGVIVEIVLCIIQCLAFYLGGGGSVLFITLELLAIAQVLLGCVARYIAEHKMYMPPLSLVNAYIVGTFAPIITAFVLEEILVPWHGTNSGLGNLPNLGKILTLGMLFFAVPAIIANGVLQSLLCKRKVKRVRAVRAARRAALEQRNKLEEL